MKISDLQYELPSERIAQSPADRRDESRLLVLDRVRGDRSHRVFSELPDLLPPDSLLVLNDTRVLPARLCMFRRTGGRVECLFLRESCFGQWEIMVTGAGRLKTGEELLIDGEAQRIRLLERTGPGTWQAETVPAGDARAILEQHGRPPLPPYIRRDDVTAEQLADDIERYQTIFAQKPGAVAAPTAGLHFTPEIFDRLSERGIEHVFVTLHVGVGTFAPIRCDDLADHDMHSEWYDCPEITASAINTARQEKRPIVAVGTTSVRVLESCSDETGTVTASTGSTKLFIYPPYRFRVVDHMLTNFHLPGSTLLAMVLALGGRANILAAYRDAIENGYRFYSYGDAMLIR